MNDKKEQKYSWKKLDEIEDQIERLKLYGFVVDILILFFRGLFVPAALFVHWFVNLVIDLVRFVIKLPEVIVALSLLLWDIIKFLFFFACFICMLIWPFYFLYQIGKAFLH